MMPSRVLVVNAGSSSLKFKLFDVIGKTINATVGGLLERIGDVENSQIVVKVRIFFLMRNETS
jgi:acetate kinase